MEPHFRTWADGSPNLTDTAEATKVKDINKAKPWVRPVSPEGVLDKARKDLIQHHGDPANRKHLLGFFEVQFGVFRGQTFRWVAENALGYAAHQVAAMKRDPTGGSKDSHDRGHNKMCFREYVELFPSARFAIALKEEQYTGKTPHHLTPGRVCLPAGWIHALPEVDQRWISTALFRWTVQGHPELDYSRVDKIWWYPPQVPLKTSDSPALENYFGHSLLLWMPQKLWQVKMTCPRPDCHKELLTSAGLHQNIRQVVGVGNMYFVASEYLTCRRCKRKVISWSRGIVSQLDIGHRVQFPCIITSKLACDIEVARLMHQRGLGSSSRQIQRKLQERHAEVWLQKTVQYLTDCKGIASAVTSGLILPVTFEPAPTMLPIPKHRWLMQVYAQDVLQRLDEIKATITSQYGQILKMGSTKKVARKLTGESYGAATWAASVGNEHGQMIMSVLTASEGSGLRRMIEGLVRRYRAAGVAPPEVLYVDRDCCGNTLLRRMFEEWEQMTIRLDTWHFMLRFAAGCTTNSHQLYATFMSGLSHCIFMWDQDDLRALKEAKYAELEDEGKQLSGADVLHCISESELALHCRRTTRGTKETQALIESHIQVFEGSAGRDTLGVPLINSARMSELWKSQRKHVACIQDPPGVQLYTQTGTIVKGGRRLPTYRCARGSASLESFHLHLNKFIPGKVASDIFFQAYLLDGLARWNEDRAVAATADEQQPHSYIHLLRHAVSTLTEEVLGEKIIPYVGPRKYTDELIGVEYLYQQTGKVLQDYNLAIEESETTDVGVEVDEGYTELEQFQDITVPTLDTEGTPAASSQPSVSVVPSSPVTSLATSSMSSQSVVPPSPVTSHETSSLLTQSKPALSPGAHSSPLDKLSAETDLPTPEESTSLDDSVGPDSIEGFGVVQDLAEFLVGLRDHRLALTEEQYAQIITLWQALGGKKKTVYPPCHQTTLKQARFRAMKKSVASGVESTERCLVGAHNPAQRPDCSRVVEAVFTRLCALYPNDVRCDGVRVSRFTTVKRAYNRIRERINSNAELMSEATVQLPEVNAARVTQWFSRCCKSQEQHTVKQGIPAPDAPMAGPEQLPVALQKGPTLQSKLKRRPQPQSISQAPPPHQTLPVIASAPPASLPFILPPVLLPTVPGRSQVMVFNLPLPSAVPPSTQTSNKDVPYTTQQYRKRKAQEREHTGVVTRKYIKKTDVILCRKCQKERKPPSHLQYFGNWYCEESETQSHDEWRAELEKRGYGRKKDRK